MDIDGGKSLTSSGKVKRNFTLAPDVIPMLDILAGGERNKGIFISQLIREAWAKHQEGDTATRLASLEARLSAIERGIPHAIEQTP